jgi:LEA14-like dessication related protein
VTRTIQIILTAIVLFALQACSLLRQEFADPDIQVIGLQHVSGGNLLNQRFLLQLQLTNPNDLQLEVKGIHFQLEVAGLPLMQGVSNQIPVIKPYSTIEFTVEGSANVIQAVKLIRKMQKKPQQRFDYLLNTRVELARGWPETFNLQRQGDVSLGDWKP